MESKGFFISIITILLLLSGCSNKPSLELVSSTVDIGNDEERLGGIEIISGEKRGEIIVPAALSYKFVLKNTGNNTLGSANSPNPTTFEYDDGIKVHIEPNEKLKAVSEEIIGVNIFDAELAIGKSSVPIIEPNQEGTYTFDFRLSYNDENPELRVVPSVEQLEKLENNAMEASLIVTIKGEEIARFDLSNLN